ncbi:hypothetical protein NDU88_012462 [Pleurodeles waltl]|uniref:Uncharacterized protein n=1 Tax=Pleurodeles waltl TaxID=8319 RepID=A0AAV7R057_PLEWA|nr:hypothetical protein NDU88_012462 [Pleurodeles waltl]
MSRAQVPPAALWIRAHGPRGLSGSERTVALRVWSQVPGFSGQKHSSSPMLHIQLRSRTSPPLPSALPASSRTRLNEPTDHVNGSHARPAPGSSSAKRAVVG